jgi:hypothetical protein
MPHINPFVSHVTIGGFFGQPLGCFLTDQIRVVRPFVRSIKFVQI